jgi:integrase/recombinase XerD
MLTLIPPLLVPPLESSARPAVVDALAVVPEEDVWLASCKSRHTREAYARDVRHFLRTLAITSRAQLRAIDHRAVIAWERHMREVEGAQPTTIRRRLAALSSLFGHLVRYRVVGYNPVREVKRPVINRGEGLTPAFTPQQARALLEAPDPTTLKGLRDRAILSLGLQVGLRRSEIVRLKVRDLLTNRGADALRLTRKGGKRDLLAIHPDTAQRLRAYLDASGHGADRDGPLVRPLHPNGTAPSVRRHLEAQRIDRILHTYVRQLGFGAWLFGPFHAGHLHHDGVGEWRQAGGCPKDRRACQPGDDTALRSWAIYAPEISSLTGGVLNGWRKPRRMEGLQRRCSRSTRLPLGCGPWPRQNVISFPGPWRVECSPHVGDRRRLACRAAV